MKRLCGVLACAVAAVGLVAGCEWESGGDGNSWSDSFNWVNFSGTYRNSAGGVLVSAYTSTTSTTTTTTTEGKSGSSSTSVTNSTTNATIKTVSAKVSGGTLPANQLSASGTIPKTPIKPGTVTIQIGSDIALADDGNGVLKGNGGSGTVSYDGGAWTFDLADIQSSPLARKITVNYAYLVTVGGGSTTSGDSGTSTGDSGSGSGKSSSSTTTTTTTSLGGGQKSGASGRAIYSFVVVHRGQNLTITDNNGAVYKGHFGDLRATSGITPEASNKTEKGTLVLPKDGDTIVGTFNCKGTSAAGMPVTITGTFQGTVSAGVFTGRTMQGTWIEAGGKTGDINGSTTSIPISTTTETTTSETTTSDET